MKFQEKFSKKTILMIYIIITILVMAVIPVSNYINIDLLIAVIFGIALYGLFLIKPYFFLKYFFIVYYSVFMLVGVYICNNTNIHLSEIATYANYNGSFSIAVLYNMILIFSLVFFDTYISKKNKSFLPEKRFLRYKKFKNVIYCIFFLIGLVMFFSVIKYPSFKMMLDRFNYTYAPNWALKLKRLYLFASPLLLIEFINEKINVKKIIKYVLCVLPYFLFGIWCGEKFGLFFDFIALLLSPIAVYLLKGKLEILEHVDLTFDADKAKLVNKKIKRIVIFFAILSFILLVPFYILRDMNAKEAIFNRISQQGQLWWKTYEIEKDSSMHLNEIGDEMKPIKDAISGKDIPVSEGINYNYGIYKIMKITTPYNGVKNKLLTNSRYSAQGIEIAYYYMKDIGIVLHSIIRALCEAFIINLFIKYVLSFRFVEVIITARLINIVHAIFTQGDLYKLFSIETLGSIFILIIIGLWYLKKRKENNYKLLNSNFIN